MEKRGHFRALLTNFPSGFPVFRLTVIDTSFPRTGRDTALTPLSCRSLVKQARLGTQTAAENVEENIAQFKEGVGVAEKQHLWL